MNRQRSKVAAPAADFGYGVGHMKLEHQSDGCQGLTETWTVTRWALIVGAVLVPAAVAASQIVDGAFGVKGLLGAGVGGLVMLGIAAAISDLRVRFDVARRVMRWEQRNWFRRRRIDVPFADIVDVYVSSSTTRSDDTTVGGYHATHRLMVKTGTDALPLTMSEGSDRPAYEGLRRQVLALLAPRVATGEPATVVDHLVAEGRLIDATAAIRAERGVDLATARTMVDDIRRRIHASRTNGGHADGR
jgi:hypothetical protein